jgi:hypothetical protein
VCYTNGLCQSISVDTVSAFCTEGNRVLCCVIIMCVTYVPTAASTIRAMETAGSSETSEHICHATVVEYPRRWYFQSPLWEPQNLTWYLHFMQVPGYLGKSWYFNLTNPKNLRRLRMIEHLISSTLIFKEEPCLRILTMLFIYCTNEFC